MSEKKVKVLYIAGWVRSGTTILDNILGQIDGFFSGGELFYIWGRSIIENRLCGCGAPFKDCDIWREILNQAFGGVDQVDASAMLAMGHEVRARHIPLLWLRPTQPRFTRRPEWYLDNLARLYTAIQSSTGCRVIVDSSKSPFYANELRMIPAIDLYVIHLVRDPRGVGYSGSQRRKPQPDLGNRPLEAHGLVRSSLMWNLWNLSAERLWRHSPEHYLMLRYEDFITQPRNTISRILEWVQETTPQLPFVTEREVELGINHTVSGNPNRFRHGTTELCLDEEWKKKALRSDKMLVALLTWPLLIKYGYSPFHQRDIATPGTLF